MDRQHNLPPPEHEEHPDAEVEAMLAKARRSGDPWSMPPEERDTFMAGYYAGRDSGYDDGYAAGYAACDDEMARRQQHISQALRTLARMPEGSGAPVDGVPAGPFPICTRCRAGDQARCGDTQHDADVRECSCQHPPGTAPWAAGVEPAEDEVPDQLEESS